MNDDRWLYRGFEFCNSYERVDDDFLDGVELQLEYPLPLDYREFLKEHNGGQFVDNISFAITDTCVDLERGCRYFYDVGGILRMLDFRSTTHGLPRWRLPIAQTAASQFEVYISLHADNYGVVFRGDYSPPEAMERRLEYREIARSFNDWLSSFELSEFQAYNYPKIIEDPAFYAAASGDVATLREMLAGGLDENLRNDQGDTLLLVANRRPRVVELLLEFDADPNLANPHGFIPIYWAGYDVTCLLLEHGADSNIGHPDYGPALFNADRRRMQLLLEHGADPNFVNSNGGSLCSVRGVDQELIISHGFDTELVFTRLMAILEDPDSRWNDVVPLPSSPTGLSSITELRNYAHDVESRVHMALENSESPLVRARLQKLVDFWEEQSKTRFRLPTGNSQ